MAQVPVSMQVIVYPRNKTVKPYPATIVGYAWITGLEPGGGPMPGGGDEHPAHPIELPPIEEPPPIPDVPPDQTPHVTLIVKPAPAEGGWGCSNDDGWFYVPPPDTARPKGGGRR